MTASLTFNPMAPPEMLMALAAVALTLALVYIWRSPAAGMFRAIALVGILGLLSDPQIRSAEETPLDDVALVLIDKSASQRLDGRDDVSDRAADALEARLQRLGGVDTRRVEVLGDEETRLAEALAAALADAPRAQLAAAFVITDGQASDEARAETLLKAAPDAPVHAFVTGRDDEVDRRISLIDAPRYGIVRETAEVSFRIDDETIDGEPLPGDRSTDVVLRIDGEEVLRERVPVGVDVSFEAPLERPGPLVIELEAAARDGELTTRNNIAVLPITAIRDRLRVLLISGEPHPGERVWRNLLKSDPAIDLVHFTILRPFEKSDTALQHELALIEFPRDELFIEKLTEFDLLIFDRYTYRGVLDAYHFDNIARYVEMGGGVLIASGPEFNSPLSLAARRNLAFILPALPSTSAVDGAFRPMISEDGARHPVTTDLPEEEFWGRWLRIMPVEKKDGATLMEGEAGEPLLILNRVGEGRVGLLLSDHVWLWARGFDGGGPHAELLRRVSHWLMKEPELEEESLTLTPDGEDLIVTRRTLSREAPSVRIEAPDGRIYEPDLREQSAGLFNARLTSPGRGLYRARSGDLFAVGAVGLAAAPEFANVVASPAKASAVTTRSGGGVFRIRRGEGLALPALRRVRASSTLRAGTGWAGVANMNAARVDSVAAAPLAPPWAWLGLVGAALVAGWVVDGRRLRLRSLGGRQAR